MKKIQAIDYNEEQNSQKKDQLIESEITSFFDEKGDSAAISQLLENKIIKSYQKKEAIFLENTMPNELYFINKGKVKITKANEFGKEYMMTIRKSGDFIGYLALMKNEKYPISAYTLEPSSISIIPKTDFFNLLHTNRIVANRFIKMLTENIVEKEKQLLSLAYNSVRKRVAEALVRLHKKYKIEGKLNTEIVILREDLANMVGTAKETVIRTLSDFKEEKLVKIKGSRITILNLYGLEHIIA